MISLSGEVTWDNRKLLSITTTTMNYRKFDGHQIAPGDITKLQSIMRTVVDTDQPKVFDSYPDSSINKSGLCVDDGYLL